MTCPQCGRSVRNPFIPANVGRLARSGAKIALLTLIAMLSLIGLVTVLATVADTDRADPWHTRNDVEWISLHQKVDQ